MKAKPIKSKTRLKLLNRFDLNSSNFIYRFSFTHFLSDKAFNLEVRTKHIIFYSIYYLDWHDSNLVDATITQFELDSLCLLNRDNAILSKVGIGILKP